MKGIYWLASYPKSGNTWVRCMLSALQGCQDGPEGLINSLNGYAAASRSLFDRVAGLDSSELDSEEILQIRPRVYEKMAEQSESILFFKIHDAWRRGRRNVVPLNATLGVVYLIRNPLDVAVSFAHHGGVTMDQAIAWMADPDHGLCLDDERFHHQLPQRLSTWSNHVAGWTDSPEFPLLVVRYEDLYNAPAASLSQIASFLGLNRNPKAIAAAVERCRFEELRREESQYGFQEKHVRCKAFFRKGRVGSWQDELTGGQAQHIIDNHSQAMRQFGYLTDSGAVSQICR